MNFRTARIAILSFPVNVPLFQLNICFMYIKTSDRKETFVWKTNITETNPKYLQMGFRAKGMICTLKRYPTKCDKIFTSYTADKGPTL